MVSQNRPSDPKLTHEFPANGSAVTNLCNLFCPGLQNILLERRVCGKKMLQVEDKFLSRSRLHRYEEKCWNQRCFKKKHEISFPTMVVPSALVIMADKLELLQIVLGWNVLV